MACRSQGVLLQPFWISALGPRVKPEDDSGALLLQARSDVFEAFELLELAHGGEGRGGGEDALAAAGDAVGVDLVDPLDDLVGGLRAAVDVDLPRALGAARRRALQ